MASSPAGTEVEGDVGVPVELSSKSVEEIAAQVRESGKTGVHVVQPAERVLSESVEKAEVVHKLFSEVAAALMNHQD
ncbi:hypothetical protein K7X08_027724 [Anisodus acutangulus]|uniref:Uncharacterized protein n=1 Tax=Anisodus acutangulus TaxID=402998 RepID=A0A9Q1LJN8_9SOLA|nr:hypothetical protein K7X08_027724 [Anisodus acutangulus]